MAPHPLRQRLREGRTEDLPPLPAAGEIDLIVGRPHQPPLPDGFEREALWTKAERRKGQAWGLKTIESFHTHGTPPLPSQSGSETVGQDDLAAKGIAS